jgi:hypothetical protein
MNLSKQQHQKEEIYEFFVELGSCPSSIAAVGASAQLFQMNPRCVPALVTFSFQVGGECNCRIHLTTPTVLPPNCLLEKKREHVSTQRSNFFFQRITMRVFQQLQNIHKNPLSLVNNIRSHNSQQNFNSFFLNEQNKTKSQSNKILNCF